MKNGMRQLDIADARGTEDALPWLGRTFDIESHGTWHTKYEGFQRQRA